MTRNSELAIRRPPRHPKSRQGNEAVTACRAMIIMPNNIESSNKTDC